MSALPQTPPGAEGAIPSGDSDAQETREWLDALSAVVAAEGRERGHYLIEQLLEHARQQGIDRPFSATTGYVNTIEPEDEIRSPGNLELEGRLRAYMRWNAMALVVKANRLHPADGGDLGATSVLSPLWRTCLPPASTTSGMPKVKATAAICSTSKATAAPAFTPALSWKAELRKSKCSISAKK